MNGKIVTGGIVLTALAAGAALYYLQVYAYYGPVNVSSPAAVMRLTALNGSTEPMLTEDFQGIDADSSPLRFRGCFTTPMSIALLSETYTLYETPTPLVAPGWFSCFDAGHIGADLKSGAALAFLSEPDIHPGVDRVIAVYPDGRAYAWHQLNKSADE
jgi:hypothetical protein